jgi:purine-binding chemotaxis protein CheW
MTHKKQLIEKQKILHERAKTLAAENISETQRNNILSVARFHINSEKYGINIEYVYRISKLQSVVFIPCLPSYILGIVNVHGKIIPTIDLIKLFNLPEKPNRSSECILILQLDNTYLGIIIDSIHEVKQISADEIQANLPMLTGIHADYLHGVTADRITILDAEKLLSDDRLIIEEQV